MSRKSRKNVGLIGLGIIGSRITKVLRSANFNVYVWSRTPRAQPNFLGSPAEVAEACEVIQIFVSDAEALFDVIEAFDDKLTPRHIILCNATVGPDATLEAARRVAEKGGKFIDAPFTGSKLAAERGELVYYLGGDDELLDRVDPVLRASSKATVRVGHIGQAATVKVATNMLVASIAQGLAETVALMQRAGVNPVVLEEALEHHAVHSKLIDMKLPMMLQGDYEPHFTVGNLSKDVQLALALAEYREIALPATVATGEVLRQSIDRGWGDLDFSAVIKIYQAQDAVPPSLTIEPKPAPIGNVETPKPVAVAAPEKTRAETVGQDGEENPESAPLSAEASQEYAGEAEPAPSPPPEEVGEKSNAEIADEHAWTKDGVADEPSVLEHSPEELGEPQHEGAEEGEPTAAQEPEHGIPAPDETASSEPDTPPPKERGLLRRFFG